MTTLCITNIFSGLLNTTTVESLVATMNTTDTVSMSTQSRWFLLAGKLTPECSDMDENESLLIATVDKLHVSFSLSKSASKWWFIGKAPNIVGIVNTKCPVRLQTIFNFANCEFDVTLRVAIFRERKQLDSIIKMAETEKGLYLLKGSGGQKIVGNISMRETFCKARDAKNIEEAIAIIADEQPQYALLNWDDCKKRVHSYFKPDAKRMKIMYSLDQFTGPSLDQYLAEVSVHLYGPSGVGKTS